MKRLILTTSVLGGLALASAGWAGAEPASKEHEGHHPPAAAKTAPGVGAPEATGKMGDKMADKPGGEKGMCAMMKGGDMKATGGSMAAMMDMGGAGTQIAVKNTDKGVTITLTATDPAKVVRLQKMAEAMRLMHEATAP
jgi:hypothetical protein